MNNTLVKLGSLQEIARFSLENIEHFNSVNVSTACSRLAKLLSRDSKKRRLARASEPLDRRRGSAAPASGDDNEEAWKAIQVLSTRAMGMISTFQSRAVASLLSALSALKEQPEPQLVAALLKRAIEVAETFTPQSLAIILSAITIVAEGKTLVELLDVVLERAMATADTFGPHEITCMMKTLANVGLAPGIKLDRLTMAVSRRASAIARNFKRGEILSLNRSLQMLGAAPIVVRLADTTSRSRVC
jgi:hypothetical protein